MNQHLALCRPVGGFSVEYLVRFLQSETGKRSLLRLERGATKAGLGLDDIRAVPVPFPPITEQFEICRVVDDLLTVATEVESVSRRSLRDASTLRQSILKLAFEGRLVPQDPNDEPASVLLERIRASRKSEKPATNRPRKRKSRQGSLDL